MHLRETFGRLTAGFRDQHPEAVPGHGHLIRLLLLAQQRLQTMQALVHTILGLRQFSATGVFVRGVPGRWLEWRAGQTGFEGSPSGENAWLQMSHTPVPEVSERGNHDS